MPWLTTGSCAWCRSSPRSSTAAFVILLFANEPPEATPVPSAAAGSGQAIFDDPLRALPRRRRQRRLRPRARRRRRRTRFPDPADQEAVVTNGRGSMPSFADSLTPEQIAAVVEYTRTGLG